MSSGSSPIKPRHPIPIEDRWVRVVMMGFGVGIAGLLITAGQLSPDPTGRGTHTQLGLPTCSTVRLFGVPCPSCGMTTSWTYLMRGRIAQAATANAGGLVLGIVAVVASPWLFVSGLRGRWFLWRPPVLFWAIVFGAVMVAMITSWIMALL